MKRFFRGPPLERIMRYVQYDTNGGCWLWDSGTNSNGYLEYAAFTDENGKGGKKVSRFMYKKFNGEIPEGHIIRHKCNVSLCVNPDHLITGTHQDNMNDRKKRFEIEKRKPSISNILICHECGNKFNAIKKSARFCTYKCNIINLKRRKNINEH